MIAGQEVAVLTGAQQALRRVQYGSGEAGVVVPDHLFSPSRRGFSVVLMTTTLHGRVLPTVRFVTLHDMFVLSVSGA